MSNYATYWNIAETMAFAVNLFMNVVNDSEIAYNVGCHVVDELGIF